MKKDHLNLNKAEKTLLGKIIAKGNMPERVIKRATGLLELDKGKTIAEVADELGVARVTVTSWRDGFGERRIECINDKPRPGRPPKLNERARAKIAAIVTKKAPRGFTEWSPSMVAKKAVELGICDRISPAQVKDILKGTPMGSTMKKSTGARKSARM
jgi:transposase